VSPADRFRPQDKNGHEKAAGTVHLSVMCGEVVAALAPRAGEVLVDGTFGAGGYSSALLAAAECQVIGIDRDPTVRIHADRVSTAHPGRFRLLAGRFGDMDMLLSEIGIQGVDGVALDIGVSSMQIDQADRGFSFQQDGPLDMRMSDHGETAADIVNTRDEAELADIIYLYGEERRARAVARAIVTARTEAPITRTRQLVQIVGRVVRATPGINPATRTFQALRIVVNDELGELRRGLVAAEKLLKPEGRLAVVSFHSLEDRIVKRFLTERSGRASRGSRHAPAQAPSHEATFTVSGKQPHMPEEKEVRANPRSRSARLRWAERTIAPCLNELA